MYGPTVQFCQRGNILAFKPDKNIYLNGTIVLKQGHVINMGRHGEIKDKCLVSVVMKQCPDPAGVALPQTP